MHQNKLPITKKYKSEYKVFLLFFFAMLLVMLPADVWEGSDDTYNIAQLETMNILDWVWMRATTWQPRLVSDFLMGIFNFNIPVWRVTTAIVTTLLLFTVCTMSNFENEDPQYSAYLYAITCCSFFCIFPHVISSSICWYAGCFNYLWPTLFLLVALVPFYRALIGAPVTSKAVLTLAIICSNFAPYNEQTAAVLICFGLITIGALILMKKRVPMYLLLELVCAVFHVGVFMYLGGTSIRQSAEISWYVNFPMLSTIDKLFQGINWSNYQLINASNILMFILTGLLYLIAYYRYESATIRLLFALPVLFIGIGLIPFDTIFNRVSNIYMYGRMEEYSLSVGSVVKHLLYPMAARPHNFNLDLWNLFPSMLSLAAVIYIAGLIFIGFKEKKLAFANTLLYFASLASSYAISISPTIFASANRVFFVTDVLLVFLVSALFKELQQYVCLYKKRWFKIAMTILLFVAFCYMLVQIEFNVSGGFTF